MAWNLEKVHEHYVMRLSEEMGALNCIVIILSLATCMGALQHRLFLASGKYSMVWHCEFADPGLSIPLSKQRCTTSLNFILGYHSFPKRAIVIVLATPTSYRLKDLTINYL